MDHRLFAGLLGQRFELHPPTGGTSLSVELVEARCLGTAPTPAGRLPFTLLFKAEQGPVLSQQIYRLSHPALPPLDIFLGPVASAGDGPCYEAVFN